MTLFVVLIFASLAGADIYRYVDENGVVYYTDMKLNRNAVRIIKHEAVVIDKKGPLTDAFGSRPLDSNSDLSAIVNEKAAKYELDPSLVHAVIKAESNGNQYAVSRKGAMGLMQLMPLTAHELQVGNPFDPEDNIEGGTKYLKYLIEKFNGDLTLALAAYNAGPNRVEQTGSVPKITETKQYIKKVLSFYKSSPNIPAASKQSVVKKSENIYMVLAEDGTVLFTNSILHKKQAGF